MVLRGGSDAFVDEAERSLHDAVMIVRRAIKNAAVHGIGLACTLSCVLQQEIAEGKLVVIETDPAPPPVPVKILVRPDALCRDFIEAFIPSLVEGLQP